MFSKFFDDFLFFIPPNRLLQAFNLPKGIEKNQHHFNKAVNEEKEQRQHHFAITVGVFFFNSTSVHQILSIADMTFFFFCMKSLQKTVPLRQLVSLSERLSVLFENISY